MSKNGLIRNLTPACGIPEAGGTITAPHAHAAPAEAEVAKPSVKPDRVRSYTDEFVVRSIRIRSRDPPQGSVSPDPLRERAAPRQLGEAAGSRSARTSFRIRNRLHRNHRKLCPNFCPDCRKHIQTLVHRSGTARKFIPFWTKNLHHGLHSRPIQSVTFLGVLNLSL